MQEELSDSSSQKSPRRTESVQQQQPSTNDQNSNNKETTVHPLQKLERTIKEANVLKKVNDEHKEYHVLLSKFGKTIEKVKYEREKKKVPKFECPK